jgi:hypothetical protein
MFLLSLALVSCSSSNDTAPGRDADPACFADEPTVEIGIGDIEFEPVDEGDTVYMQHGAQGGEHILGSIRLWHMSQIVTVHYTIARESDGSLVSDQAFRVAMIEEPDCAYMYPGMYGYLGLTSEYTQSLQNTNVILQMDATDSDGRAASDSVGVLIGQEGRP